MSFNSCKKLLLSSHKVVFSPFFQFCISNVLDPYLPLNLLDCFIPTLALFIYTVRATAFTLNKKLKWKILTQIAVWNWKMLIKIVLWDHWTIIYYCLFLFSLFSFLIWFIKSISLLKNMFFARELVHFPTILFNVLTENF